MKAEGLEAEWSVRSKNVNKVGAGIIMLMREVRGSLNGGGRLGRACGGVTESDVSLCGSGTRSWQCYVYYI